MASNKVTKSLTDLNIITSDITTNDASVTKHGFLLKATAPAAGLTNVVSIENGETVYKNKALFDATVPSTQDYGDAAAVGSAVVSARRDHKHAMPASGGIADEAVTNAKLAHIATATIKGRVTAATGDVEDLTAANVRTIINVADGATANTKATGAEIDTKTDDTKFATPKALDDQTVLLKKIGGTMTGTIILATGSTTVAPIKMVAGTNLTTPVAGAIEFDGTDYFITV